MNNKIINQLRTLKLKKGFCLVYKEMWDNSYLEKSQFSTAIIEVNNTTNKIFTDGINYGIEMCVAVIESTPDEENNIKYLLSKLPATFWDDEDHSVGGYVSKKELFEILNK